MKNSAWNHKLWRKRLSELPLKEDDNTAWINMRNLLDEHLPVDATHSPAATPPGIVLFKSTVYIIAAAAIISTAIYMLAHHSKQTSVTDINRKQHHQPDTKNSINSHQQTDGSGNQQYISSNRDSLTNNKASTNSKPDIAASDQQNIAAQQLANTNKSAGKVANADQYTIANSAIIKSNSPTAPRVNTPGTPSKINPHYDIYDLQKNKSYKHGNDSKRHSSHQQSGSLFITKINGNSSGHRLANGVSSSNTTSGNAISLTSPQTPGDKQQQSKTAKPDASKAESTTKPDRATENAIGSSKIDMGKPVSNQQQGKPARNNNSGGRSQKLPEAKTVKNNPAKNKQQTPISNPQYNYGLEAGLSMAHGNSNLYLGGYGSYALTKRLLLNAGLRLNIAKSTSGEYSHASYYRPDSLPSFKITDSRKLILLDIPLTLEYRLSNLISFNAGPVISIPLKQSGINYKFGPIVDQRDTLYHTKTIDSTMKRTTVSKVNFGGTVGVTFRIKQFNIDARYQVITPYKLSNGFGSYSQSAKSLQIGIGYRFK